MIAYSLYSYDPRLKREAEALVRHGNRVTFLVLKEADTPRIYESNGVVIEELKASKYRGNSAIAYISSYALFLYKAFLACTRHYIKNSVDVIHVHNMPNVLVLAGFIPRLFGIPIILDIHDTIPETFEAKLDEPSPLLQRILCMEEKFSCSIANYLICVNDVQKNKIVERGIRREKITVIMNVADPTVFKCQTADHINVNKNTFDMVYHGTVDRMLGLDLVLEAMPRLIESIPGVRFHLIGTGPFLGNLIAQSEKMNLGKYVNFSKRAYPVSELPGMLKEMDIGIVPNRKNRATELMLPVKLMEYAALGLPVVAPRLRTIEHYFSSDMISFFDPDDSESLAQAVERLHHDQARRREQIRHMASFLNQYDWERHQLDLINLYRNIKYVDQEAG